MKTKIPISEIMEAIKSRDYVGFCRACGKMAYGVEPDAEQYECEACGKNAVYGAEQLLIMGA